MSLPEHIKKQLRELAALAYDDKGSKPEFNRKMVIDTIYKSAPPELADACAYYFNIVWMEEAVKRKYNVGLGGIKDF